MDWEEDVDPFNLENLTNLTQYKEHQPVELDLNDSALDKLIKDIQTRASTENTTLKYKIYSVHQKLCFCIILRSNFLKLQELQKGLE